MHLRPLPHQILNCNQHSLDLSSAHVMGILNVTPDSFSDGGKYDDVEKALQHALSMIKDGATIIDIGGESTRPGATVVTIDQELKRVIPVVKALSAFDVILSIDTSEPQVIEAAVKAGAHIWNDVRGLTRPNALETAARLQIPIVMMHMRGEPTTMNHLDHYTDVTHDVMLELQQRIDAALNAGVLKEKIIIDPGFGFAKNAEQNLRLLNELYKLTDMGYPMLSALSRKRFIGEVLDGALAEDRAIGSVAGHLISIQQGASIVRAHDVKAMSDAVKIWNRLQLMNQGVKK